MINKLYCPKCNIAVAYKINFKNESYIIKRKVIKSLSEVAYCVKCERELFHSELDNENLKKAYTLYEIDYGKIIPERVINNKLMDTLQKGANCNIFKTRLFKRIVGISILSLIFSLPIIHMIYLVGFIQVLIGMAITTGLMSGIFLAINLLVD